MSLLPRYPILLVLVNLSVFFFIQQPTFKGEMLEQLPLQHEHTQFVGKGDAWQRSAVIE